MNPPNAQQRPEFDPLKELQSAIECYSKGKFQESHAKCLAVLDHHPDWVQALHILGITQFRLQEIQSAILTLRKSIDLDGTYFPPYNDLANMLRHQGEFQSAVEILLKLNALQPNHVVTLNNLGLALKENDQLDEAIEYLQQVLNLDSDHRNALLNLGYTYQKKDEPKAAIDAFERAFKALTGRSRTLNGAGKTLSCRRR